ncbi:putative membrane protein YfcA [Amorphus suaedae]
MTIDGYSTTLLIQLTVGLIATGVVAGVLAGLLGVGGGIVIVPVLFWIMTTLHFDPAIAMPIAVATSLTTIIPTSISSMRAHNKRGAVDISLLKLWGPAVAVGALIGGGLSKVIDGQGLLFIFGIIALAVSVNMAIPKTLVISEQLPKSSWVNRAIAFVIGLFSSLMGIGGGTLSVPTLSSFSFPIHKAVGTASAIGLLIAVPGVLGFIWSGMGVDGRPPLSLGYISVPAAIVIFPVTFLCAPIGAGLAHSLNQRYLKLAFAVFLAITAVKMLSSAF